MITEPLKFVVAPHIVQDLGLNLYTSLPRVLVEFIANAYDADADFVNITMNFEQIEAARREIKRQFEFEKEQVDGEQLNVESLERRTLPPSIKIIIEDNGHGMSRADFAQKFLIAGRRRLEEEKSAGGRTIKNRPIMGRKGLGKLAGFGVAKKIEVTSRVAEAEEATKILLDYDEILMKRNVNDVEIPEESLSNGGGFAVSGTRIVLSSLMYDPVKSRSQTINDEIADHFDLILPDEFEIRINDVLIEPDQREIAYAWPEPSIPFEQFIDSSITLESGNVITFGYRMRFTADRQALSAARRGVRVYVNRRLAAAPSLLSADTNMHGFRMTDYLDGIVHADFIAQQEADYIATDRQALRWESPLLSPLYEFLSAEITEACKRYQAFRDSLAPQAVNADDFTNNLIEEHSFTRKDEALARRIATILYKSCKQGTSDPLYHSTLPSLFRGLGQGQILTAISELASAEHPELERVAVEIARLTKDEMDHFSGFVKTRLKAIEALKKIVEEVNFKASKSEKTLQKMFEESAWLLDPTYSQFLTANTSFNSMFRRLAQYLQVGDAAPARQEGDNRRPDLVFLLGSESLQRIIIVELKDANVPLNSQHHDQLELYMQRTEEWLRYHNISGMQIRGELIGSLGDGTSNAEHQVLLARRLERAGNDTPWRVRDYLKVLDDTESAHKELLRVYRELPNN